MRVAKFIEGGREAFFESEQEQDAVIRNIEVIGEAAKRVGPETRGLMVQIDWRAICGMRDVLIHGYIGVDLEEVWNVAEREIPVLSESLKRFLDGE